MNIEDIPTEELKKDLQDSIDDISICSLSLAVGVYEYNDGNKKCSVQNRLDTNAEIIKVIEAELIERGEIEVGNDYRLL